MSQLVKLDAVTSEKFKEFLGRDPHPSAGRQQVLNIKQPRFPQFLFQWHPQTRKVYLIRTGHWSADNEFVPNPPGASTHASIIAEHAETRGHAENFVQTFLRGYHEAKTPDLIKRES